MHHKISSSFVSSNDWITTSSRLGLADLSLSPVLSAVGSVLCKER